MALMRQRIRHWLWLGWFAALWGVAPVVYAATTPSTITVVMDNNYPPYTFLDAEGHLQGILKDTWDLWSKHTGIAVNIEAMDWSQAQAQMAAGQADVIDTIFETPERRKHYDFSAPYADIDVSIFFNRKISGIVDADSLRGFTVGVKAGDACIDTLQQHHITSLKSYPSYEAMIDAAARDDVVVFCIDKPPAMYFLYKKGLSQRFNYTRPLSVGQFHWAVRQGDTALKQLIAGGFAQITASERQQIHEKWLGSALTNGLSVMTTRGIIEALLVVLGVIGCLAFWNWSLQLRVEAKTAEQAAAQKIIEEQNMRFSMASDAAGLGFWDYDPYSGRIEWDDWMYRIYHREREQYANPTELWENATHPEDRAQKTQNLNEAILGGCEFDTEYRILLPDGAIHHVKSLASAIRDTNGQAIRLFGITFDVTKERRAEQRQLQLVNQLTRINDELNSFAYVASHDLKSPLRGIDQLATWITEDLGDTLSEDTRNYLRLMRSRINRMEMLLDDLLTYSRVGRISDDVVTVNTHELVQAAFDLTASGGKQIVLHLADDMPVLQTRKVPLELVFRNLIGNAIKHHDKKQGIIEVSANPVENGIEFAVKDDGPGVPLEHQQRIFAMFQTLKPRDEVEGSGIGLALVKKAVESVGGKVTLESDGQHGCTFRFTWPTVIPEEQST